MRGGISLFSSLSYSFSAILARFIVLFFAITVHEFSHGYAAYKLGDPTAKYSGRLSLNPLAHLDPIGALCMLLFRFGWAKPVPINPMYFRNRKRDTAITALAGPVANILLALISVILLAPLIVFVFPNHSNFITEFLYRLLIECIGVNMSFAAFNLIPFPPLDGSKVLGIFLSAENYNTLLQYERFGFPILILLSFTGLLSNAISFITTPIAAFLQFVLNLLIRLLG